MPATTSVCAWILKPSADCVNLVAEVFCGGWAGASEQVSRGVVVGKLA